MRRWQAKHLTHQLNEPPRLVCSLGADWSYHLPLHIQMTTDTPRTRMETAHLLCDSDNFEDVISTLKKEGEELERELDEAKAEVERLRSMVIRSLQIAKSIDDPLNLGMEDYYREQIEQIEATLN